MYEKKGLIWKLDYVRCGSNGQDAKKRYSFLHMQSSFAPLLSRIEVDWRLVNAIGILMKLLLAMLLNQAEELQGTSCHFLALTQTFSWIFFFHSAEHELLQRIANKSINTSWFYIPMQTLKGKKSYVMPFSANEWSRAILFWGLSSKASKIQLLCLRWKDIALTTSSLHFNKEDKASILSQGQLVSIMHLLLH